MDLTNTLSVMNTFSFLRALTEYSHGITEIFREMGLRYTKPTSKPISRHFRVSKNPHFQNEAESNIFHFKMNFIWRRTEMIAAMYDRLWAPGRIWAICNVELHLACN